MVINLYGRSYFFDGDRPTSPLFWTHHPLHYDDWPKTMMIAEDCRILSFLDTLPQHLPMR